ncbi:MAG: hypothetical protein LBU27_04000 [Candidatus Peribacteria bacterium]|nr:hypothetical protein [Candidatus Peribacteria bacterium]
MRKALDKNANDILTNQQIIGSYAIKTDNILKSIPELMEGLTTIYFPLYDTISDEATHFITALKKVYTINSTDVYAVIFKESIDLILRAIEAGNYTSVDAQHYLRSFNAENPIHGLWDYYFE